MAAKFSFILFTIVICVGIGLSYEFTVQPTLEWQNTGVSVLAGSGISFSASGEISDHLGTHWYSPNGLCQVEPDSLICIAGEDYLVAGVSRYALVSKIGDGTGFFVGTSNFILVEGSGDIYLAFNDCYYPDNLGNFYVTFTTEAAFDFIRGDSEADMDVEMADAIEILKYLYIPGHPDLSCLDAGDANDSGVVDASDSIYLLRYLYVPGEPPPPAPFPGCGDDPTSDALGCASHPCGGTK